MEKCFISFFKQSKVKRINYFVENNEIRSDNAEIVELFKTYFDKIVGNLGINHNLESVQESFKDILKAFDDFKNKLFLKSSKNTIVKKMLFRKKKTLQKMSSFFFSRAPTHHSFTFNLWFVYELKHKVDLSKTMSGIFHFRFRLVFVKCIFLFNKMHGLFDFKTS